MSASPNAASARTSSTKTSPKVAGAKKSDAKSPNVPPTLKVWLRRHQMARLPRKVGLRRKVARQPCQMLRLPRSDTPTSPNAHKTHSKITKYSRRIIAKCPGHTFSLWQIVETIAAAPLLLCRPPRQQFWQFVEIRNSPTIPRKRANSKLPWTSRKRLQE